MSCLGVGCGYSIVELGSNWLRLGSCCPPYQMENIVGVKVYSKAHWSLGVRELKYSPEAVEVPARK